MNAEKDDRDLTVWFVTRKWPPAMGGMETYCWELWRRLRQHVALRLIALPGRENGSVPSFAAVSWFGLSAAWKILTARRVDVVHVGDLAIWPLAWIAAARHPHATIVVSVHGSDISFAQGRTLRSRLYHCYIRLGSRLLRRVRLIANSGWIAGLLRDQGFRNLTVVPLATNLRAASAVGQQSGSLFFAGRIIPSKGLSFIVQDVLPLVDPAISLRVAGTVCDEQEAAVLKSPRVIYLGVLSPEALAREYGQSLCTLVPSLTPEGFGLVAAEAAACGTAVIASNHSGLAEVVTSEIGFVVEAGNAQAWADQINKIINWSADERSKLLGGSQRAALARYCWNRVADDTLALYRS
jgi:glycosyltransferase involved in cell wall biosynthesis